MEIENVVIVGSGFMGSGIAYVTAMAGVNVTLIDREQKFLDKAMSNLKEMIKEGISRGKMSAHQGQQLSERFNSSTDLAGAVKQADLIIEAVYEDMKLKKEIFSQLSTFARSEAILVTNTSTLSITKIAEGLSNPSRIAGLHFFSPVPAMKLVEIIKGVETSDDTINTLSEFSARIGKTSVFAKDSPGFIFNRIFVTMSNEAVKLIDEGIATKEDIDRAAVLGGNSPAGPLTIADMVGLDVFLASIETLHRELGDFYKPAQTLVNLVKEGKLGLKTKEGFYKYA